MIDIREDILASIKCILAKHVPGYEVRAFGSRVTWTAHEASDLDLAIVGEKKLSWKIMAKLKAALEESTVPFRVDVLDWNAIPENFRVNIGKKFEVIQKAATKEGFRKIIEGQAVKILLPQSAFNEMRLGDVCEKIGSGATPRGGNSVYLDAGEISLIRSQNIYNDGFHRDGLVYITQVHADQLNNVEVKERDVLLNITGDSVARCCQVAPDILPARVNQHVAIIRPTGKNLLAEYLRYYMVSLSTQNELLSLAGAGATRPALTKGMIENLKILAPEVTTQRAIAHILGTLDDKIELNRRMNQTLEEIARVLYKSWFVDFDPVRKKAAGEPTGLPEEIDRLFPSEFEESELGMIPKGWKVKPIPEIIDFNPTVRLSKGQEAKYASMADIPTKGFIVPSVEIKPYAGGAKYRKNDVLLARITPCLENGKTAIAHFLDDKEIGFGSTEFIVLRSTKNVSYHFVYLLSRDDNFRTHCISNMVGSSGRQRVQNTCFEHFRIPVSGKEVYQHFSDFVDPIFDAIVAHGKSGKSLEAMRDSILPQLLSGILTIPNAEELLTEAGL